MLPCSQASKTHKYVRLLVLDPVLTKNLKRTLCIAALPSPQYDVKELSVYVYVWVDGRRIKVAVSVFAARNAVAAPVVSSGILKRVLLQSLCDIDAAYW